MIIGISMGSRDLSDSWTGFTQFTLLEEKPPDGFMWSWGEIDEKTQLTSRPESFMARNSGSQWEKHAKLKEKQKWSNEKAPFGKRRKNCEGSIFIDPEDKEFKENH